MRLLYFLACLLAALDLVGKAIGLEPSLIQADYIWLNWLPAFGWFIAGLYAFVWRPD